MTDPFQTQFDAAQGFAQNELKSDPYYLLAQGISAAPLQFTNPWANFGGTLAKGFLGGIGEGAAMSGYNQNLTDAYNNLGGIFTGAPIRPELQPYANQIQASINSYNRERADKFNDALLSNQLSLNNTIAGKQFDKYLDFENDPAVIAARQENRTVVNPNLPSGGKAIQPPSGDAQAFNPAPPKPQDFNAKTGELDTGASGVFKANTTSTDPRADAYKKKQTFELADQEAKLRTEFSKLPVVQDYELSEIGFRSLLKAMEDPTGTSDLELVRGAIQAIEPGMAVREGEQYAAQNSGSIPGSLKAAIDKALTGGSGLSPDVREGIIRIAKRRYDEHARKFMEKRKSYLGLSESYGYSPGNVVTIPEAEDLNYKGSAQPAFKAPDGRMVELID